MGVALWDIYRRGVFICSTGFFVLQGDSVPYFLKHFETVGALVSWLCYQILLNGHSYGVKPVSLENIIVILHPN